MLKKRLIIVLTFYNGILYRTKKFNPDYRYTKNFIDFWEVDEIVLIDISKNKLKNSFLEIVNFFSSVVISLSSLLFVLSFTISYI